MPDSVTACDSSLLYSIDRYAEVLSRGLLDRSNEAANAIKPFDRIFLSQENKLHSISFHEALSITEVMDSIGAITGAINDSVCRGLIAASLRRSIKPNATYDDSLTQKLLASELSKIVEIEGKVEKGTAIIDRGDIVSEERYKVLESLKTEYGERVISDTGFHWSIIGALGVICALIGLLILFVYMNQQRLFNDPRPMTLVLSLVSISFAFSTLAIGSDAISIYAIPVGITPLLLRMFYDFRVSIFTFVIFCFDNRAVCSKST